MASTIKPGQRPLGLLQPRAEEGMAAIVAPSNAEEEQALAILRARFPEAAAAELLRFGRARQHSAAAACELYEAHLQWRRGPGAPERLAEAARAVPVKFIRGAGVARDGSLLMLVEGARYDPSVGPEEHVLAVAKELDKLLLPDDLRRATVLIDTRGREGWPNPPSYEMLPFFRAANALIPDQYPERIQVAVIYPMPGIVTHLWWIVSCMMERATRDKFVLLEGIGGRDAPCPAELSQYVALDQLPVDVQARHQALAGQPVAPNEPCQHSTQTTPACPGPPAEEREEAPGASSGSETPAGVKSLRSMHSQDTASEAGGPDPIEQDPVDQERPLPAVDEPSPGAAADQPCQHGTQAAPVCLGSPAEESGDAPGAFAGSEDPVGAASLRSVPSRDGAPEPGNPEPAEQDPVDQERPLPSVDEPSLEQEESSCSAQ